MRRRLAAAGCVGGLALGAVVGAAASADAVQTLEAGIRAQAPRSGGLAAAGGVRIITVSWTGKAGKHRLRWRARKLSGGIPANGWTTKWAGSKAFAKATNRYTITGLTPSSIYQVQLDVAKRSRWIKVATRTATPTAPVQSVKCATGGSCALGDTGPGGGTVFLIESNIAQTKWEVAPAGWAGAGNAGSDPERIWGCSGALPIGLDQAGTAMDLGAANTAYIDHECNYTTRDDMAPRMAKYYTANGKSDWFLPSKDELNRLCRFVRGQESDSDALCESTGSVRSGFSYGYYWSSSQNNAASGWAQDFTDGSQSGALKSLAMQVRPVRKFG